jgi:ABC-type molybdate transport system substrate-binding protein
MRLSGGQTKEGVASQAMPPAPPPPPPVPAVETIQMVYSSEKSAWLKAVTADFEKVNPDIRVDLVSRGSIDAANDILDERLKTTVWSPADTSLLAMLASEWRTKYKAPLFADAETARQPLLLTPLVFMIWEDRAQALMKAGGGTVRWKTIRQGMLSPKGWGGIGGEARWENVVLAHVDPRRSAAGLKALYSMLLEHAGKLRMGLEDLRNPKNLEFVRGIERNVTKVESSTATLATDMVRYGSSRYEIGVVYESNAIVALADAKGGWGKLKVFYPAPTLWSDNPAVVLTAPWVTEGQARAARRYVDYLRSRPAQVRTIEYGFRPADTSVSLNDSDGKNPFSQYADRGLSVEVPPAADMPDSATIRPLIAAWNSMMKP